MATNEFTYKLAEDEDELKGAFEVRRQVFAEEQGIQEDLVFDSSDSGAIHVVIKDGQSVIGTVRVRFLETEQTKLERMAILRPFRGMGLGKRMMSFILEELKSKEIKEITLHAQYEVIPFYEACGFDTVGLPFEEAGIKHIKMERKL